MERQIEKPIEIDERLKGTIFQSINCGVRTIFRVSSSLFASSTTSSSSAFYFDLYLTVSSELLFRMSLFKRKKEKKWFFVSFLCTFSLDQRTTILFSMEESLSILRSI